MNKELIFDNLEVIRNYLNLTLEKFSILGGRSASYYRNKVLDDKLPDLDFISTISKKVYITIGDILNKRIKLSLTIMEVK